MDDIRTFDDPLKFKPDYSWPKEGANRNCPKCENPMQLNEDNPNFYGKPWWCPSCQWQFSEEELS